MCKVKHGLWIFYLLIICGISYADNKKDYISRDYVDLIEINHFYDENGRLVFDQVIFLDWKDNVDVWIKVNEDDLESTRFTISKYQVRAWRLVKNPNQIPTKNWELNVYETFWQDGEQTRFVKSKSIRETWTQYDPELVEREFLPKEKRKELRTVEVKKKKVEPPMGAIRPKIEEPAQ